MYTKFSKVSKLFYTTVLIMLLCSCGAVSSITNDKLTGDWKLNGNKVVVNDLGSEVEIYTSDSCLLIQEKITTEIKPHNFSLSDQSLDIDFIYMPLKFRPKTSQVQAQLNTNLNGQLYVGWRIDKVKFEYNRLVKNDWYLDRKKFAFSSGIILGGGSTFISPTTTLQNYSGEYDGLVCTWGIATIFAYNNLTFGGTIAFDYLTNEHSNIWIYHGKPYIGLVIGLNIN